MSLQHTLTFLALTSLCTNASAQAGGSSSQLWESSFAKLSALECDVLGDTNGDGADDWMTAVVEEGVWVRSGIDASTLYNITPPIAGTGFASDSTRILDVNGDGTDDFVVSAPEEGNPTLDGACYVYSGADGSLIRRDAAPLPGRRFGQVLAYGGDIDGDGAGDYLAMDDSYPIGGDDAIHVISGATGLVLRTHRDGFLWYSGFGLDGLGDVDLDGFGDYLFMGRRRVGLGRIDSYVISGATGLPLFVIRDMVFHSRELGRGSRAGDVDQDGHADFILHHGRHQWTADAREGAWIYSGSNGQPMRPLVFALGTLTRAPQQGFVTLPAGDVDGDGLPDFLVGDTSMGHVGDAGRGVVYVHSGATGHPLWLQNGPRSATQSTFGHTALSGDFNGDGAFDFLMTGIPFGGGIPWVEAWEYQSHLKMDSHEAEVLNGDLVNFDLDFGIIHAGKDYMILMSGRVTNPFERGVMIPLNRGTRLEASAQGSYPFSSHVGLHGTLNASGQAQATFLIAPGSAWQALFETYWFSAVAMPAGQLPEASSTALPLTFVY